MKENLTIKINFTGGLISPGDLLQILQAAKRAGVSNVSFGQRQQLFIEVAPEYMQQLTQSLKKLHVHHEVDADYFPNISSSYPAEEVFITRTWLSEGVYKDIFDSFDYRPTLKINISDSRQSFTPMLTGNINWIASSSQHFWYLVIRFPKTNQVYHWKQLIYTNDIAAVSKRIEIATLSNPGKYYDNQQADGDALFDEVMTSNHFISKEVAEPLHLAEYQLPYYEGLNKFFDKYWLGIYRRDEKFSIDFLIDTCSICLITKLGRICTTPWKSLIIKGIEEKDKQAWNELLIKHQINVRHAANELNFQVEDHCDAGLALKQFCVKHLNFDDARTFGICFGIKTRSKSEVFCNILIRRKSLFTIGDKGFFNLYDVLFSKDFNPNERTATVFSRNNIKAWLPEQIRRAIVAFGAYATNQCKPVETSLPMQEEKKKRQQHNVYQCSECLTVYDKEFGDELAGIAAGTSFNELPEDYCCPTCESDKSNFTPVNFYDLVAA